MRSRESWPCKIKWLELALTSSVIWVNSPFPCISVFSLWSEGVGPNELIQISRGVRLYAIRLHSAHKLICTAFLKSLNQLPAFKNWEKLQKNLVSWLSLKDQKISTRSLVLRKPLLAWTALQLSLRGVCPLHCHSPYQARIPLLYHLPKSWSNWVYDPWAVVTLTSWAISG